MGEGLRSGPGAQAALYASVSALFWGWVPGAVRALTDRGGHPVIRRSPGPCAASKNPRQLPCAEDEVSEAVSERLLVTRPEAVAATRLAAGTAQ